MRVFDTIRGCSLCQTALPRNPVRGGERLFCCSGCRAVFGILQVQGGLGNVRDHPLFQSAVEAGVISNPDLLEELASPSSEVATLHLEIEEMWCPSCAQLIKLVSSRLSGVVSASVDYSTDLSLVRYDPRRVGPEEILLAISRLGYRPARIEEGRRSSRSLLLRIGVAGFCLLNLMMLALPTYAGQWRGEVGGYSQLVDLSFWFALPALIYCGWPIYRRALLSLRFGQVGMELLVTIAVWSSFLLSLFSSAVYFDSMAALLFFVLVGKWIERRAKFSVRSSLLALARALPKRARCRTPQGDVYRPLKEISVGETLVAFSGEKIALDGEVVEGEGVCDESLITGEATPIAKRVGSKLVGGSVLLSGPIAYRVLRASSKSTLHRIVEMVQLDLPDKRLSTPLVDRIARWLVPAVLLLALLLAFDPVRALAVLLIACPCAIGIAAPLVQSLVMHRFSKMGALVRNRSVLHWLGREDRILFDKTGTITDGKFTVQSGLDELSPDQRALLKGLASHSIHPVSLAIASAMDEPPAHYDRIEERAGLGMWGWIDETEYRLDRDGFFREGELLGKPVLGEQVRPGVKEMVAALDLPTELLSGDGHEAVAVVAEEAGIEQIRAACSPLEKREVVRGYVDSGEIVCMVGDGINDGPALASSHVAVSLASASDLSIQLSDLLLTRGDLSILPQLRRLAIIGRKRVAQNLVWAFGYNAIGVGVAATGHLSPLMAALLMVTSSLVVTANALRKIK